MLSRSGQRASRTLLRLTVGREIPPSPSQLPIAAHCHQRPFSTSFSSSSPLNNPSLAFPCVDANEARTARLLAKQGPALDSSDPAPSSSEDGGPEPSYTNVVSGYKVYHHDQALQLDYGGELPSFDIAYETWGTLNEDKTNAILLHTGLSASSHAASHPKNTAKGWWEDYIGPGKPLDTNRFFIICTNVIGGCYGSTGPSSPHPLDPEGNPWATRFPIISIFDMVRAQFVLLDNMGIQKLHTSVGSSMGGMQSVAATHMYPERVGRLISISGCARSAPASIALRYAQRSVLMSDPNWNRGFYYDAGRLPPHTGMKLARQIATITYRSGPEWEQRFGRERRRAGGTTRNRSAAPLMEGTNGEGLEPELPPALCPDFLIETYLDHQGEQFCLKYDANSLIYVSKAMDLFDMSENALMELERRKEEHRVARQKEEVDGMAIDPQAIAEELSEASKPSGTNNRSLHVSPTDASTGEAPSPPRRQHIQTLSSPSAHTYLQSLARGLKNISSHPTLILGAQSDILFPIDQQRELAECLRRNGNSKVRYYEIDAPHGHDSFLIDVANVGGAIKGFLD